MKKPLDLHKAAILRIQQAIDRQRYFGVKIIQRDWGLECRGKKWIASPSGCCALGAVLLEEQLHQPGVCAGILVARALHVPHGWVRDFTDGFDERKFNAWLDEHGWRNFAKLAYDAGRKVH